ncbi:hypothetical protein C7420_101828 [Pantoea ananatis]|nr:hypothetical protein C7420_101828 [Pantoea ananatis]
MAEEDPKITLVVETELQAFTLMEIIGATKEH